MDDVPQEGRAHEIGRLVDVVCVSCTGGRPPLVEDIAYGRRGLERAQDRNQVVDAALAVRVVLIEDGARIGVVTR